MGELRRHVVARPAGPRQRVASQASSSTSRRSGRRSASAARRSSRSPAAARARVHDAVPARGEPRRVAAVERHAQPRRHPLGEPHAARLVPRVARPAARRRRALAEIVHEHRVADGERESLRRRAVERAHDVHAGVDLGMVADGCGTPNSASTSGRSAASAPQSRSTASIRDGCGSIRPRASSCQTRSGASVASSPDAATACASAPRVSGATTKPKRAAKRATRSTRSGSSAKAGDTWRSTPARRSAAPPKGSISAPFSSRAIALIVRSRRSRSSSSVTSGEAKNSKPR